MNRPAGQPRRRIAAEQRLVRRVVAGLVIGAATMLAVATLDTFGGTTVPVLGSFAALPAGPSEPEVIEVPAPPATPGTCLNWTRPDAADTAVVDCAQPHLFEQAGSVLLTDQALLPDDQAMRQLVKERCTPVVVSYLGGQFDPVGRYRVGALKPSPAKWDQGDRELRCGIQSASRSGALYPLTGKAAESDQSNVQQPGTCLAIDGLNIGDPVSCDGAHAVETVGIVDLSAQFPDAYPQVTPDQDAYLQPECLRIATEYAGSPEAITSKGLTVYWDNLGEASWAAGTRKVNCNLAALLPDKSGFAPVVGSVKGNVVVGGQPAPPATNLPAAGEPAPAVAPTIPDPAAPPAPELGPPLDGQPQPTQAPDPAAEQPPVDGEQPPPTTAPAPTTAPPLVDLPDVQVGDG